MQRNVIQALTYAHRIIERVLTLIRLQADMLVPTSGAEAFLLLKNAVGYMHNYPGLVHHPAEETLFERLLRRAPETAALCAHLSAQHRDFDCQECAMLERIGAAQTGDLAAIQVLKQAAFTYCAGHADHIHREETAAFPQARKRLTDEDWRNVHAVTRLELDPLADPAVLERYGSLYDYLMAGDQSFQRH